MTPQTTQYIERKTEGSIDFDPRFDVGRETSSYTPPEIAPEKKDTVVFEHGTERAGAETDNTYVATRFAQQNNDSVTLQTLSIKARAAALARKEDAHAQIDALVKLAVEGGKKGVLEAISTAKHLDDYYILDKLRGKLMTEELRRRLRENGVIFDDE